MPDVSAYERRFRRAGLPLLIEDYSASRDVFNRAVPLLGLVFVGELLGALNLDWSPAANIAAVAGGLAIFLGAFALVNRAQGRPMRSLPREVGPAELTVFVLVPAVLPAVFGGQWRSALVTAAGNLLLLGLIYLVVGYGVLSIVRWAAGRLLGQLASSVILLARAVPLLLIFAVVLFLTTEMWQVFSAAPPAFLAGMGVLLGLIGTLFPAVRLPREVRELEREAGAGPPLAGRQRLNVGLVMFVSQVLQVTVVAVAIGAFFVAFGILAV